MVFREIVKGIFYGLLGIAIFLILVFVTGCAIAKTTDNPTVKWYVFIAKQRLFVRNKNDSLTLEQGNHLFCTEPKYLRNIGLSLHELNEVADENK